MNLFQWGYITVAIVCLAMAAQNGLFAARLRERRVYLLFALTSAAAAVDALVQRRFLTVRTPREAEALFAWSAVSICTFLGLFIWFLAARTGAVRRRFLWTVSGLLAVSAVIDLILPAGMPAFVRVEGLRDVLLPWGETIRLAEGTPVVWRLVGDATNLAFLALLLDTTLRLARRERRREAILVGGSLVALGLAVLAIIPADLGLINLPSLHPFAFLLIVAGTSWELSDRVVQTAVLSREVIRGEARWRQLVENAPLLLVTVDSDGRLTSVNRRFEMARGLPAGDVLGRSLGELVPDEERDRAEQAFRDVMSGHPQEEYEGELVTSSGERRTIAWRQVLLRDAAGAPEGVLSLGRDVTEQRGAERARDEARRQLERSVRDLEKLRHRLEEENLVLREAVGQAENDSSMIGSSPALMYVLHKVRHVAPTGATVLLTGETGTGKELVARMVHRESPRASGPFVAVNCAALPPGLVESELFGHERGAFTGADRMRRGRFELADGGTLFLDEIAELSLDLQPKLLRVLQEGEIERVGADRARSVDVRVIAATNRDLNQEVEAGRFRPDLFYRLDVYPVTIPPLRDRLEDIPALVEHFVHKVAIREGIRVEEIPREVLRHLSQHGWPGNVRELQNVLERAVLRCTDGVLRLTDPLVKTPAEAAAAVDREERRLRPTLDELQRDYILQVLRECDGQVAGPGGAAEVLGLHPNTLRSRMRKLGSRPPAAGPVSIPGPRRVTDTRRRHEIS